MTLFVKPGLTKCKKNINIPAGNEAMAPQKSAKGRGNEMNRLILVVLICCCCLALEPLAWAGGNILPGGTIGGAASLGRGGASNAVVGDGSAFYHNVANIAGTQFLEFDLSTLVSRSWYQGSDCPDGQNSELGLSPVPLMALTNRLGPNWTIGTAIYGSDGIGVQHKKGPYRKSLLTSVNFTTAIAYNNDDNTFSAGFGADVVYGQLSCRGIFDQLGIAVTPVDVTNDLDGIGYGWRLGVRQEFTEWLTASLSYSPPRKLKLRGSSDIALFDLELGRLKAETEINFPGKLGLGLLLKPAETVRVSVDADLNLYDLEKINLDFGLFQLAQITEWKSNPSVKVGVEKDFNANWTGRAGAGILWPAIPIEHRTRTIPDGLGFHGALGGTWTNDAKDFAIDFAVGVSGADGEVISPMGEGQTKNRIGYAAIAARWLF
ncbi:MAG: outer membrane protein transport protein [Candidatus Buchananbacteria bacterium]